MSSLKNKFCQLRHREFSVFAWQFFFADHGTEGIISAADSQVKVVVVPTDEELMIASDTIDILDRK